MAEFNANGQAGQPQLVLQKIYVKDASFEAPNAPQIFQEMGETEAQPQVQLNLATRPWTSATTCSKWSCRSP